VVSLSPSGSVVELPVQDPIWAVRAHHAVGHRKHTVKLARGAVSVVRLRLWLLLLLLLMMLGDSVMGEQCLNSKLKTQIVCSPYD
jgi:hypothetical protein